MEIFEIARNLVEVILQYCCPPSLGPMRTNQSDFSQESEFEELEIQYALLRKRLIEVVENKVDLPPIIQGCDTLEACWRYLDRKKKKPKDFERILNKEFEKMLS